jgi:argininosuccinate synthase
VLAFSGGLDTSFCIPWLKERGYAVHTVFADTGGVDAEERQYIEQRAAELGAASHVTVDGGPAIWMASSSPSCGRVRATRASIRCWCRIAI